jgi:threonine dehydrogenase-like Zn-dependent dehydrogenase
VKQTLKLETDRPFVLRQAIQAICKGGTLSIPGVYGSVLDKVNFGAPFGKGIQMHMGQTHMHNFLKPLLETSSKVISTKPPDLTPRWYRPGSGDVFEVQKKRMA